MRDGDGPTPVWKALKFWVALLLAAWAAALVLYLLRDRGEDAPRHDAFAPDAQVVSYIR